MRRFGEVSFGRFAMDSRAFRTGAGAGGWTVWNNQHRVHQDHRVPQELNLQLGCLHAHQLRANPRPSRRVTWVP